MRPDDEMLDGVPVDGVPVDDESEALFLADGHLSEGAAHAFVDGALADEEAARVIAHVAGCPACAGRVAEARGLTAAATRILGALDDVPAGVVPEVPAATAVPAVPAANTGPARDAAVRSIAAARADRQARGGRRWTGWPVRAAASLVLAAGLGSVVWRASRNDRPAGGMVGAADSAASAPLAGGAPAMAMARRPVDTGAAASTAATSARAVTAPNAARSLAVARPRLAERSVTPDVVATAPGGTAERRLHAPPMQLAAADSVSPPAPAPTVAPAPPPAAVPSSPALPSAAAGAVASAMPAAGTTGARRRVAAPSDAATRAEVSRAGVPAAAAFEPPAAMMKAAPAPAVPAAAIAPPCAVLGGAPSVAGQPGPVRVRLDSTGLLVPAPPGVTARWRLAGDSLRLVWRWVDAGTPARAEVRLGAPDGDGLRRGTARDAAGASGPASARPVRCDGGLR